MALQLTKDFYQQADSGDEKLSREVTFFFLDIEVVMQDAEVAKLSDDNLYAIDKFIQVVDRCKQFPDKTKKTVISA